MVRVFLSYRRKDSQDITRSLCEAFKAEKSDVFMDVDGGIPEGDNFRTYIRDWVQKSDVMFVMIGSKWAELFRSTEPEQDYVRIEIETGIEFGIRIIPVLVNGAKMPATEELPETIGRRITELQASYFSSGRNYGEEKTRLIEILRRLDRGKQTPRPAVTPEGVVPPTSQNGAPSMARGGGATGDAQTSPRFDSGGAMAAWGATETRGRPTAPRIIPREMARFREARSDLAKTGREVLELLDRGSLDTVFEGHGVSLRTAIRQRMDRLEAQRFRVGIVGAFNAGKTTLLNALLGQRLLPVGIRPTTSVSSHLTWAQEVAVTVEFENGRTQKIAPKELKSYVTEKGNPGNELRVRDIHIEAPIPLLKDGVELVDTPGLDSTHDHHTATTYKMVSECDAVILVAPARHPFGESTRLFYSEVRHYVRDKVFYLLNKIDQIEPENVDQTIQYALGQLNDPTLRLGTSAAYAALFGRRVLDGDLDFSELEFDNRMTRFAEAQSAEEIIAASGLPAFESQILNFLEEHRGIPLVRSTARELTELLASAERTLQTEVDALALTREEQLAASKDLEEKQASALAEFQRRLEDHKAALREDLSDAEVRANLAADRLTRIILEAFVIQDTDLQSREAVKALLTRFQGHAQATLREAISNLGDELTLAVAQFKRRSGHALSLLKLTLSSEFDADMSQEADVDLSALATSAQDLDTGEIGLMDFAGSLAWSGAIGFVAEMIIPFGGILLGPALAFFNNQAKEDKLIEARGALESKLAGQVAELVPQVIQGVKESVARTETRLWEAVSEQEARIEAEFGAQLVVLGTDRQETAAEQEARGHELRLLRAETRVLRERLLGLVKS